MSTQERIRLPVAGSTNRRISELNLVELNLPKRVEAIGERLAREAKQSLSELVEDLILQAERERHQPRPVVRLPKSRKTPGVCEGVDLADFKSVRDIMDH